MKKENIIREKSLDFALKMIDLFKTLQKSNEYVISKQLLKSGTSIGANIEEASAAQSRKDFISKMAIASKEARETKYWLNLLERSQLVKYDYSVYQKEIDDIINIITAIVKTTSTA